jgi:DNA-binding response OmpR family regulator
MALDKEKSFPMTAKDDMTTGAAGMALGVRGFLVKPVNHADLLARIQTQLAVRRWEQKADRASAAIEPTKPPMTLDKEKSSPQTTVLLVIDDTKDMVDSLTRFLLRHGMTVLQAYNGAECLETVRSHTVDVVLLDVAMPGMDGLAVCAELKQISPALPIIFMTTRAAMDLPKGAAGIDL